MKTKVLMALFTIVLCGKSMAQGVFQSNVATTGSWTDAGSWTLLSGSDANGIPDANDNVTIVSGDIITLPGSSTQQVNNFTINAGGTLNIPNASDDARLEFSDGAIVNINGDITQGASAANNSMTFLGDHTITVNGNISTDTISFTGNGSSVIYAGSGATTVSRFEINNNKTITFNHSGTLTILQALNIDYTITLNGTGIIDINAPGDPDDLNLRTGASLSIGCTINVGDDIAIQDDNLFLTVLTGGTLNIIGGSTNRLRIGAGGPGNSFTLTVQNGGTFYVDEEVQINNQNNVLFDNYGQMTFNNDIVGIPAGANALNIINNSTGVLNIFTDIENNCILNFSAAGNTVVYSGNGDIEDAVADDYQNLIINNSRNLLDNINIGGDLTIAGSGTMGLTSYSVTLNGSSTQALTLSGGLTNSSGTGFYTLILNNTGGGNADITLNSPVVIDNNFTLTNGVVVSTSINMLTVNNGATITLNGIPQDNSYVGGPMTYNLASTALTTLTFPIGKGGLFKRVDLDIEQSAATSTNYTAEVFNTTALGLYDESAVERVSSVRYYNISQSPSTGLDGTQITIYYGGDDEVDNPADLRVAKSQAGAWVDMGGSGSGFPGGSIQSGSFTSFSDFALANVLGSIDPNPLPIELLSFNALLNDKKVDVKWSTASELNNDFFTIERSKDLSEFEIISEVKGAGNSSGILDYKIRDENPYLGTSYYRLKQTDFDGTFTYSKLVTIENNSDETIKIDLFPNPANQIVNLSIQNFHGRLQIKIFDIAGVLKKELEFEPGYQFKFLNPIDLTGFQEGIYIVEINSVNYSLVKKLIVK